MCVFLLLLLLLLCLRIRLLLFFFISSSSPSSSSSPPPLFPDVSTLEPGQADVVEGDVGFYLPLLDFARAVAAGKLPGISAGPHLT